MNVVLLLALAAAPTAPGAPDLVRRLVDDVGPRLAGTAGDAKAVAWATAELKAAGLENVHLEPVPVSRWERGEASATVVGVSQPLALTALGGSPGTPPAGIEAEVLEVDSLASLEKLDPAAVKGRIVFLNQPMERTRAYEGYRGVAPGRRSGPATAEQLGAAAFLIRSLTASADRFPHTGTMKATAIPSAALAVPDAEQLHRRIAAGAPVRLKLVLSCKKLGEASSSNVIGEVKGSEKPDEVVLLGAHLDSWDLSSGASDDGAGVAVVIAAAKALAALPKHPKRTVRVVLFANEENGLTGSDAYATAHQDELEKHFLAIELDHGAARVSGATVLAAPSAGPSLKNFAAALRPFGVKEVGRKPAHGADLTPLLAAGVPMAMLEQDSSEYFDVHHSANDTLEKLDLVALDQVAGATFAFVRAVADEPSSLGRVPPELRSE